MSGLVSVGLDDGSRLVLETVDDDDVGPVQAGRMADTLQELPGSLRAMLRPIVQASREVLAELREARPDEVKVEFGVKLTAGVGAVLTKSEVGGNLKVTLVWSGGAASGPDDDADA